MKNKKVLLSSLIVIIIFISLIFCINFLSQNKEIKESTNTTESTWNVFAQDMDSYKLTDSSEVETSSSKSSFNIEDTHAYKLANEYLEVSYFSKKKLEEQLVYEGYDEDVAEYVVKKLDVNWYEQAIGMCNEYDSKKTWSSEKLTGQLMYEGFPSGLAKQAVSDYLSK